MFKKYLFLFLITMFTIDSMTSNNLNNNSEENHDNDYEEISKDIGYLAGFGSALSFMAVISGIYMTAKQEIVYNKNFSIGNLIIRNYSKKRSALLIASYSLLSYFLAKYSYKKLTQKNP